MLWEGVQQDGRCVGIWQAGATLIWGEEIELPIEVASDGEHVISQGSN